MARRNILWREGKYSSGGRVVRLPCFLYVSFNLSHEFSLWMQELFQDKRLPLGVYSCNMLCTSWYSLPVNAVLTVIAPQSFPCNREKPTLSSWPSYPLPHLSHLNTPRFKRSITAFIKETGKLLLFPVLQNNNAASPCFSHTHCKQFPEHPG